MLFPGGTIVPLEKNTVRFIDNFSTGSRGAASAEYFLAQGCVSFHKFARTVCLTYVLFHKFARTVCHIYYYIIHFTTHAILEELFSVSLTNLRCVNTAPTVLIVADIELFSYQGRRATWCRNCRRAFANRVD